MFQGYVGVFLTWTPSPRKNPISGRSANGDKGGRENQVPIVCKLGEITVFRWLTCC